MLSGARLIAMVCLLAGVGSACQTEGETQALVPESSEASAPEVVMSPTESAANTACLEGSESIRPLEFAKEGDEGSFIVEVFSVYDASGQTGDPVFLNVGDDYPRQSASVVAFDNAAPEVTAFMRDSLAPFDFVCATGVVRKFEGRPQVVVDSLSELAFLFAGDSPNSDEVEADRVALAKVVAACQTFARGVQQLTTLSNPAGVLERLVYGHTWPDEAVFAYGSGSERAVRSLDYALGTMETALPYLTDPRTDSNLRAVILADVGGAALKATRACSRL